MHKVNHHSKFSLNIFEQHPHGPSFSRHNSVEIKHIARRLSLKTGVHFVHSNITQGISREVEFRQANTTPHVRKRKISDFKLYFFPSDHQKILPSAWKTHITHLTDSCRLKRYANSFSDKKVVEEIIRKKIEIERSPVPQIVMGKEGTASKIDMAG